MNQKLPYEKLIAEKMQELPVPDAESSWQKMNRLLDDTMPLNGASGKRPGGSWWWKGGLIVLISAGTGAIIYSNARDGGNEALVKAKTAEQTIDISEPTKPLNHIDQKFTPADADRNKENKNVVSKKNVDYTDFINAATANNSPGSNQTASAENIANDGNNTRRQTKHTSDGASVSARTDNKPHLNPLLASGEISLSPILNNSKTETGLNLITGNRSSTHNSTNNELLTSTVKYENAPADNTGSSTAGVNNSVPINPNSFSAITNASESIRRNVMASVPNGNFSYSSRQQAITDSVFVPAHVGQLPDVTAQKKAILKEMRRQERKQERELAKSYRNRQSFWGGQPERWFAAGLAPYQNVSIGGQQTYNYNSAGSKNIATDYLPAPYLQLHVTNRMYVLSEFQFNAPQSTPSLLLSQKSLTVPMSTVGYTESTYLRKLYYFNMPVSFYYSPVRNFYLGSGLQFSSFNSGLAYTEQRAANNNLVRSENIKIKDDSLSSKINSSEWRYLFDANYYANRFMLGVRYNQALNNFINLNVNNTLPPVQARNQSIQFYIRYNIIMSDKRR